MLSKHLYIVIIIIIPKFADICMHYLVCLLHVAELPSPPYNLGISNIAATSVLLQFFPGFDGKTSITLWIVQAKQAGQDTFSEIFSISAPQAREIWVQNLKPYRKYQLRIVAENIVGRSGPSDPSREFETLQAPPSSAPGNVTVRALNATSHRVSWTVSHSFHHF